jgi:hypothetical protein
MNLLKVKGIVNDVPTDAKAGDRFVISDTPSGKSAGFGRYHVEVGAMPNGDNRYNEPLTGDSVMVVIPKVEMQTFQYHPLTGWTADSTSAELL